MAGNNSGIEDGYGDKDDWIEIYNRGNEPVDLAGLFITDSLPDPYMWKIPADNRSATTVEPGGFIILWADNEPEEGILHVGFKLSKSGEQVGLFKVLDETPVLVDSVTFSSLPDDVSLARHPDGEGRWTLFDHPTPSDYNIYLGEEVQKDVFMGLNLHPNPSTGWIRISGLPDDPVINGQVARVTVMNESGRMVRQEIHPAGATIELNLSDCNAGLYLVRVTTGKQCFTAKVVLLK